MCRWTSSSPGPGRTVLATDEVLTEITLPQPAANTARSTIKHSPRGAMDIATVGVASAISLDRSGACTDAKIALGAVAPIPLRAYAAEDVLKDKALDAEVLHAAAEQAMAQATPIDDVRGTAGYRRNMVGVLTRRTLEHAAAAANGGGIDYEACRRLAIQAAV